MSSARTGKLLIDDLTKQLKMGLTITKLVDKAEYDKIVSTIDTNRYAVEIIEVRVDKDSNKMFSILVYAINP